MDSRGHWDEARTLLKRALEGVTDDTSTKASVLSKLGAFAFRQADFESAREYLRESLSLFSRLLRTPEIILEQTHIYEFNSKLEIQREPQAAREWLERGIDQLDFLRTSVARHQKGYFYVLLASTLGRMSQYSEAITAAEKGLALLPTSPTSARIIGLMVLGNVFYFLGNIAKSIKYQKQGIKIAKKLGDFRRLATLWMNMGITEENRGNLSIAIVSYQKALRFYKRMGDIDAEGSIHVNLGSVYLKLADDKKAFNHLTTAIKLAETNRLTELKAFSQTNIAHLHLVRGRLTEAHVALAKAQEICVSLEMVNLLPEVLCWQAEIARLKGDHQKGLGIIEKCLEMATQRGYVLEKGIGYSIKGKILGAIQRLDEAEMAHQTSLQLLAKQSPYDFAQSQLALAQHYVMREAALSNRAKSLLIEALAVFERLGAKRGIALTKVLLDIGKGPTFIPIRRRAM
jgi:tetratricopeptide (TPR) repeat protein